MRLNSFAQTLISEIKNDPVLKPMIHKIFYLKKIQELKNKLTLIQEDKSKELIELDFILTQSYINYMHYLSSGYIKWKDYLESIAQIEEKDKIQMIWDKYKSKKNYRKLLFLSFKKKDIFFSFKKADATFHNYQNMGQHLRRLENIQDKGGYIKVKNFLKYPTISSESLKIQRLKNRLLQNTNVSIDSCIQEDNKTPNCSALFDEDTLTAVKEFQKNVGLKVDGKVGKNTINALNTSINKRIRQLRINIERMRWLPRTLGEKHIIVNIPDYSLKLYDKKDILINMDVIIGKKEFPTPIFSNKMSFVVLNPYWRIPQKIAKEELLPQLLENPNYLEEQNIKLFTTWNHESPIIDERNIDWNIYVDNDLLGTSTKAPMRFIQVPSEINALGKMKFMFPNKYSIYLHDTPAKSLFKYKKRAFSHGCIRLKDPSALLTLLSSFNKNIDVEESEEILLAYTQASIKLNKKLPIHLVYLTSWVDENNNLQFRNDIYDYDKIQEEFIYEKEKLKI